jgi:hypothetical protein
LDPPGWFRDCTRETESGPGSASKTNISIKLSMFLKTPQLF